MAEQVANLLSFQPCRPLFVTTGLTNRPRGRILVVEFFSGSGNRHAAAGNTSSTASDVFFRLQAYFIPFFLQPRRGNFFQRPDLRRKYRNPEFLQ